MAVTDGGSVDKGRKWFMQTIQEWSNFLKAALFIITILAAVFTFGWTYYLKPKIIEEVKLELQKQEHSEWHRKNVFLALSGEQSDLVDAYLLDFKKENLIEHIIDPPKYKILEGTVNNKVDAIKVIKLEVDRSVIFESGEVKRSDNGEFMRRNRYVLRDDFYANRDQKVIVRVTPDYDGQFKKTIEDGRDMVLLKVGISEPIPINQPIMQMDVTCEVRRALGQSPEGLVKIEADTRNHFGSIKDGGFRLNVVVTVKKGSQSCD
ncbi:hypothetical protein [Pseudovibrio brasiliensis]|uniref:Uncharacterized protein n=1 Tax=Pseudovibrio brasiliensis TaxID=1898042 RepID=A0ABX8APK3_9HYPH|nr:hypothetical protein [Pseudovibrio brasiliensis]QUS55136.1 hypothetical protein KGB56_17505 [Pseudovibrio brasiliensis]